MKTVDEYLSHSYSVPEMPSVLPLPAETFVASWKEAEGKEALDFLTEISGRNNKIFPLKDQDALRIFLINEKVPDGSAKLWWLGQIKSAVIA